ncbi:MAG: MucB/RseB C-terminal domain-containing protein, partial [Proteobacteria bacterium]|nr:MucB/RseB C-terminal domain-containing protein [Pseudomonadota bacterium]
DELRYGHVLWADVQSGLLLKSRTLDQHGAVIEQFSFSELRIGGEVENSLLESRFKTDEGWRMVNARGVSMSVEAAGWVLEPAVPGYALTSAMKRPLGRDRGEAVHMVFSDGLAAISVFIEPIGEGSRAGLGPLSSGAINIFKRAIDGHLVTALGEAPEAAVRRIGEGIRPEAR